MKHIILAIFFGMHCYNLFAQQITTHEQITREGNFTVGFVDSAGTAPLHIKCIYDDDKTDDTYSIYLSNGTVSDASQPDFTLDKSLNFDVFVDKFVSKCKTKFEYKKSPNLPTLHSVFDLIWRIKTPTGDAPQAGILKLSRGILVFNEKTDGHEEKANYIKRRETTDSITARLVDAASNVKQIKEAISNKLGEDTLEIDQNITLLTRAIDIVKGFTFDKKDSVACFGALDSLTNSFLASEVMPTVQKNAYRSRWKVSLSGEQLTNFKSELIAFLTNRKQVLQADKTTIKKALKSAKYLPLYSLYNTDARGALDSLINQSKDADSVNAVALKNDTVSFGGKLTTIKYAKINKIDIQFERGFIESVKVSITIKNTEYFFENIYAIGFSSISNYNKLGNTKLYSRTGSSPVYYYIFLSDIFRNYDNNLHLSQRDYSPADTTLSVSPSEVPEVVVRKETYVNLFDAKLYTDLAGIDRTKPNGLFQIEVSKRFNLHTERKQAGGTRSDFGYFNYVDLFGSLSKIEQNNRELVLHNANLVNNGNAVSPNFATNLDFLRYENYSVGVNLGLLLFDKPDEKFTIYLDLGIRYGHVLIADSVFVASNNNFLKKFDKSLDAHTVTFQFPKLSIELFPESRITPKLSWQFNTTKLFSNNQFKQVVSYEKSDLNNFLLEKNARKSNQYEASVKIAPRKDRASHIFLRWRFFTQYSDANTSFSQFQVGYTYNWTLTR